MLDKTMTISGIVDRMSSGMTLGIAGWGGRRKPMAIIREMLRRDDLKDLTVVAYGGADVGMLASAGKIKKLVFGFVSLDTIPLEAHFRKARQAGAFDILELDEGMLQLGLKAAASRVPFLPTRVGLCTDIMAHAPEIKTITSPYADGETLVAMPALKLDMAIAHVNKADILGNSWIYGPDPFFDEWFCRAAEESYLTCEELVETSAFNDPGMAVKMPIERSLVKGVAEATCGAHPSSCAPDYGIDVAHLKDYSRTAKEGFDGYLDSFVRGQDQESYLKTVGGIEAVHKLPLPVF
ncbi:CoA transferase subunit A [Emcibacter sp.]|uniref:CoA transferase subunit A n=1 Tax=Emcibacter sp. TaxID=1979954 RepID=UPI002AA8A134|nr:CoA-transferase [Emcibacter sp.]